MRQALGQERLTGELPNPLAPPSGCQFRMRCPFATDRCVAEVPPLRESGTQHRVACHYFAEIEAGTKAAMAPSPNAARAPLATERAAHRPVRYAVLVTFSSAVNAR